MNKLKDVFHKCEITDYDAFQLAYKVNDHTYEFWEIDFPNSEEETEFSDYLRHLWNDDGSFATSKFIEDFANDNKFAVRIVENKDMWYHMVIDLNSYMKGRQIEVLQEFYSDDVIASFDSETYVKVVCKELFDDEIFG